MYKHIRFFLFVTIGMFVLLVVSGCAVNKPVETHVSKYEAELSYGMSMEEVKQKLGTPSRMLQHQRHKDKKESFSVTYFIYYFRDYWTWETKEALYIEFVDNHVIGWGPDPDTTYGLESKPDLKEEMIIEHR